MVLLGFKKCQHCTAASYHRCDARDASVVQLDKLEKQREDLTKAIHECQKTVREGIARWERLKVQRRALKEQELEWTRRSVGNILEKEQALEESGGPEISAEASTETGSDSVTLADLSSEVPVPSLSDSQRADLLSDFPIGGTSEEVSHS